MDVMPFTEGAARRRTGRVPSQAGRSAIAVLDCDLFANIVAFLGEARSAVSLLLETSKKLAASARQSPGLWKEVCAHIFL
jgi:hypothetical protein